MSEPQKKQGQPQEMQEQLSNTIRLPNSRVYLRSGENHWKVLIFYFLLEGAKSALNPLQRATQSTHPVSKQLEALSSGIRGGDSYANCKSTP